MNFENSNIKIIENDANGHKTTSQQKEEECIKDLNSLIEIQKDINSLLLGQQEKLDIVEKNVVNSEDNIEVGKEEIKKSSVLKEVYAPAKGGEEGGEAPATDEASGDAGESTDRE